MSSPVIIKIKCETYLIRFLEHLYGKQPISFPRRHDFNNILDFILEKQPLSWRDQDYGPQTLQINLPYFEDKDVRSYNYLSDFKQRKFEQRLKDFFKVTFHSYINKCLNLGFNRKDAIEMFMDEYELPVDCLDLLEKDYSRYMTIRWKRKLFKNSKNSSVKGLKKPPQERQELMESQELAESACSV